MQTMKETAANVAASAKSGMEKTKATVQEKRKVNLSVALVDAAVPCAGATAAGQGYIWRVHKTPGTDKWELAMRSHYLWGALAESVQNLGMDPLLALGWNKTGSMLVGRTAEDCSVLRRKVEQLVEVGLGAQLLSHDDLRAEEPALELGEEGGAVFMADDCQLDARRAVTFIEKIHWNRWSVVCLFLTPAMNIRLIGEANHYVGKGDRVQATVQPPNIAKYDAKVHERCLCYITDFDVTDNIMKYGLTNHKYQLTFMPNTEIFVVGDMNFPKTIYKFKTFREIHDITDFDNVGLFDFIGKVVKKYPLQNEKRTATTFISKHITIYLEDLEKQAIRCTLWGNLADEIIKHMDTTHGPLVIIIHLCKAKKWNERLELSSAFHATQLMADISIPEIQEFVSKLSPEDKSEDKVAFIQNSNSIVEDLSSGSCKVLSLNDILNTKQKGYYYVVARISSILSVGRWSYISCKRCRVKLSGSPDGYYCSSCELMETHVVPRFCVKVKVVDGNTDCIFLLWDNVCEFVLGESAKEIRTRIAREIASEKKCSEKIESEYSIERAGRPEELQGLVGHTFIFKVNIKEQNISEENPDYVFSVSGISDDNDLILKYKKTEINFTQKSEFLSWLAKNGEKIIEIDDLSDNEDHFPNQNSTKRALYANDVTNSTYVSATGSTSKIYTHRYDKKIKKEAE